MKSDQYSGHIVKNHARWMSEIMDIGVVHCREKLVLILILLISLWVCFTCANFTLCQTDCWEYLIEVDRTHALSCLYNSWENQLTLSHGSLSFFVPKGLKQMLTRRNSITVPMWISFLGARDKKRVCWFCDRIDCPVHTANSAKFPIARKRTGGDQNFIS